MCQSTLFWQAPLPGQSPLHSNVTDFFRGICENTYPRKALSSGVLWYIPECPLRMTHTLLSPSQLSRLQHG
jgi:hypothetical protein